jgi:hypothetical protein
LGLWPCAITQEAGIPADAGLEWRYMMKRYALYLFLFALLFPVSATASSAPPLIRTIIVKHFSNAMGVDKSQDFINFFCDALRDELLKEKVASQVAEDALPVADADAPNSLVIEGKFTGFDKGGVFTVGYVTMEIEMYRVSDHALMKMTTPKAIFKSSPFNKDKNVAEFTGRETAQTFKQSLKGFIPSSAMPIVINGAASGPAAPAAVAPAAAQPAPVSTADVNLSSDPSSADITVDGNYIGSTPSLIKLWPGTHSITITKTGYIPWVRYIITRSGENRNVAAQLDKAPQTP